MTGYLECRLSDEAFYAPSLADMEEALIMGSAALEGLVVQTCVAIQMKYDQVHAIYARMPEEERMARRAEGDMDKIEANMLETIRQVILLRRFLKRKDRLFHSNFHDTWRWEHPETIKYLGKTLEDFLKTTMSWVNREVYRQSNTLKMLDSTFGPSGA